MGASECREKLGAGVYFEEERFKLGLGLTDEVAGIVGDIPILDVPGLYDEFSLITDACGL